MRGALGDADLGRGLRDTNLILPLEQPQELDRGRHSAETPLAQRREGFDRNVVAIHGGY